MGGLDPSKLLVILVLALVILGPERLPKAARQIGAFWRDFNLFRERLEQEVRSALPDVDLPPIPRMPARGITGYLTGMMQEADRGSEAGGAVEGDVEEGGGAGENPPARSEWQRSGRSPTTPPPNEGPIVVPNGVPASWSVSAAESPGYASGSFLSSVPATSPEAVLRAEARLDLDDPSWN